MMSLHGLPHDWKESIQRFFFRPLDRRILKRFERAWIAVFSFYIAYFSDSELERFTAAGFHPFPEDWPLIPPQFLPWFHSTVLLLCVFGYAADETPFFLAGLLASAIYIEGVDSITSFTVNRVFIFGFGILLASRLASRDGPNISAWPVRILQLGLVAHYCGSGLSKIGGDWTIYSDTLWTQVQGSYRTSFCAFCLSHLPIDFWTMAQWTSLIFELFSPIIFFSKFRKAGLAFGIIFHAAVALLMTNLFVFSIQMIAFYLLFPNNDGTESS